MQTKIAKVIVLLLNLFLVVSIGCSPKRNDTPETTTTKKVDTTPVVRPEFHPTYTKDLEETIQTIEVNKVMFACQCADWRIVSSSQKGDAKAKLLLEDIFIEPADTSLILPDTIGYGGDRIRFWGQFYTRKGFPKNYPMTEEHPDTAKVFRYTRYKILKSYYKNFKD